MTLLYFCCDLFFFFFKQKTAYEMRISDWSSDVCSSDLKTNYKNYIDFIPTPTGLERADLSDSRFPNAPKHQLTITPKITLPVPEAWGTISALANFYYQSSVAFDPANRINGIAQRGTTVDGYGKLDLRMDWRNKIGRAQV